MKLTPLTHADVMQMHLLSLGHTVQQLRNVANISTDNTSRRLARQALKDIPRFLQLKKHCEAQGWFRPGQLLVIEGRRFET